MEKVDYKYKVLLIEDSQIDQMAFTRMVKKAELPYICVISESVTDAREKLLSETFDVIIMDCFLGDGTAFDLFDVTEDTPVIITTGAGDEKTAVKAMKAGSCDYIVKDFNRNYLQMLSLTIENVIKNKKAELKLKEYDRLKSEFVATVSHEMRTPLTIFKNIISNALAGLLGSLSPKLRENLQMADATIDRLTRIISDLLDISSVEAGRLKLNLEKFHAQSVITEAVNTLAPLADEKNICISYQLPSEPVMIKADFEKILQVLINLISNAIKFVPEKGSIDISVEEDGNNVVISIQDNGPGIEEEDTKKIFNRFVQVQRIVGPGSHGTGLGLTIAKELVEMHNGSIEVSSRLGHGTKFTFYLPLRNQSVLRTA